MNTQFEQYIINRLDSLTESVSKTCNEVTAIKTKLDLHIERKEKEQIKRFSRIKISLALISTVIGSISVYNFVQQFFSH